MGILGDKFYIKSARPCISIYLIKKQGLVAFLSYLNIRENEEFTGVLRI